MKRTINLIIIKVLYLLIVYIVCSGTLLGQIKAKKIDKAMNEFYKAEKFTGQCLLPIISE